VTIQKLKDSFPKIYSSDPRLMADHDNSMYVWIIWPPKWPKREAMKKNWRDKAKSLAKARLL
jgi:hypothetical protein